MFRSLLLTLVSISVLLVAIAFAALNPGVVWLEFGVTQIEVQKSLALTLAFAAGWVFGILCLAMALIRARLEGRRANTALRLAEAEIHTLRRLPVEHAD